MEFNTLETAVLEKMLTGPLQEFEILLDQFKHAIVTSREITGAGFYTNISLSPATNRLPFSGQRCFGDVVAKCAGLEYGIGFTLFLKDGILDFLEGYTFDEPLHAIPADFELSFASGVGRDYSKIKRDLLGQGQS